MARAAAPARGVAIDDAEELSVRAWRFLETEMRHLGTPLPEPVVPILDFIEHAEMQRTTPKERRAIVDQARLVFDHFYAHMPFKGEVFPTARPHEFLKRARALLKGPEAEFHDQMIGAFTSVRDAHTIYGLPSPFRGAVAFLPFQMTPIQDTARDRRLFVSRIMTSDESGRFGHPLFGPGVEIVQWGELPIAAHLERCCDRLPAGNLASGFARGAVACTLRPLGFCGLPFADERPAAVIGYRTEFEGPTHFIRIPWGVVRFPAGAALPSKNVSVSFLNDELNRGARLQYRDDLWEEHRLKDSTDLREVSRIPEAFEFQFTGGPRQHHPIELRHLEDFDHPGQRLGYWRIKRFSDGSSAPGATDRLVDEARRILTLLDEVAPDGLVLDIRGNPGGDIEAAERILQMLTPNPITPEDFHFVNTPAIRRVMRGLRARRRRSAAARLKLEEARLEFGDWLDDRANSGPLTGGRPLTAPDSCNDIGQVYQGRVVLLTDAFTYSAADIFAAGFQDHGIGFVYGIDQTTGGGGANVWEHADLLTRLGPDPGVPLAPLPRDVSMRVAIRRCLRVGENRGRPIEDLGVASNEVYMTVTIDDILKGSLGMIRMAAGILSKRMTLFRLDVATAKPRAGGGVSVKARATNVTSLRCFLDGELAVERPIRPGRVASFVVPPAQGVDEPSTLRIEGFSDGRLVAVRNIEFDLERPAHVRRRRRRRR